MCKCIYIWLYGQHLIKSSRLWRSHHIGTEHTESRELAELGSVSTLGDFEQCLYLLSLAGVLDPRGIQDLCQGCAEDFQAPIVCCRLENPVQDDSFVLLPADRKPGRANCPNRKYLINPDQMRLYVVHGNLKFVYWRLNLAKASSAGSGMPSTSCKGALPASASSTTASSLEPLLSTGPACAMVKGPQPVLQTVSICQIEALKSLLSQNSLSSPRSRICQSC